MLAPLESCSPINSKAARRSAMSLCCLESGAGEKPQLPVTIVVMPCLTIGLRRSLWFGSMTGQSKCEWMSMKPGVTARPDASISVSARAPDRSPRAVILSPLRPMSARFPFLPLPSITVPFRMITSRAMMESFHWCELWAQKLCESDYN